MTDHEAQAFLDRHGIAFKAVFADSTCPPWSGKKSCDHIHGDRYTITLVKGADPGAPRLTFDFWNSKNDKKAGKQPTPYDVLASISGDYHCPDTFEEFCSEYGYDEDSRSAEATFKRCRDLSGRLRSFFTEQQAQELQEIQ